MHTIFLLMQKIFLFLFVFLVANAAIQHLKGTALSAKNMQSGWFLRLLGNPVTVPYFHFFDKRLPTKVGFFPFSVATLTCSFCYRLIRFLTLKVKVRRDFAALFMVIFSGIAVCANDVKQGFSLPSHKALSVLKLTQKEERWLARHKDIRIAYDASLPPYSFVNDQGKIDGVAVEIMAILSQRLGINFTVYTDSDWHRLYRSAAKRQVDMVATMVGRSNRSEWFNFTKPYLTKSLVIVTKQDDAAVNNRNDLYNKKIAVVKGYEYAEQVARDYPRSKRITVETMLDSLLAVDKGEADAAILFLGTANYLQAKHQLTRLKSAAFYDRNSADESIAVRKDWPLFVAILQKGLDSLTEEEIQKIFAKWVVLGGAASSAGDVAKSAQPKPPPESKKTVLIENPPVNLSSQQTTSLAVPEINETRNFDGAYSLLLFLLATFVVWFQVVRKQKTPGQIAGNGEKTVAGNLLATPSETVHQKVASSPETSNDEPKPEQPIQLDIGHLKVTHEGQLKNPDDETVRYQRDAEGRFIFVSPSITSLLGYSAADFMENYRYYLTGNPINQQLEGLVEACMQGKPNELYEIEIYDVGKDIHWLEVQASAVYDGQGHCIGIEGIMRDITALRLYDKLSAKAASETDLASGSSFHQSLKEQLQSAIDLATKEQKPLTLMRLTLERLRFLDGSLLGYPDDEVLTEANKRLRATLRETDTVIELEADKFALILPEIDSLTAGLIVDKIRKILQVPYLVGVQSIVLDANIGVAIYPEHGLDTESLYNKSQELLSTSPPEMPELKIQVDYDDQGVNLRLQQDLVLALDECKVSLRASNPHNINALHRHSQFSVYYQSRHNLDDYAITGFEALIRWQHPELGLLLPKDFVELVKDIGLLDVMTYWIIQQVAFQAMFWEKKSIRPELLAINLGDLAGSQTITAAKIANIIQETGAKPEWFAFSVPEGILTRNYDLVKPIIDQLAEAGSTVAIDNFGFDSSVLAQLNTIPAQVVEIDPAFIRHLPENTADAEIIIRSIAMLHEMGKTVIAKEIETEQQLEFFKTCGCDVVQGHLLSRPLPAKEAKELMESLPDFAWYLTQ